MDSIRFAWTGLAEGALRDRNLRLHLGLGVLAGAFAAHAPLSGAERALVLLCVALVVAAESLNSAIEAVVDLASPGQHERARIAKDAAAGAVLAVAAGSVLVFLSVSAPLAPWVERQARALLVPIAGALVAAIATALLPAPRLRPRAAGVTLAAAAIAGIAAISAGARSQVGTAAAALCFAIALGTTRRRF